MQISNLFHKFQNLFTYFNTIRNGLTQGDPNKKTVHTYNSEYRLYIENTPSEYPESHKSMLEWIRLSLSFIKPGGKVLEIGSATPRDSRFIRQMGYFVQSSDAAPNFVKYMRSQGEPAILLNILERPPKNKYDLVFANAVFPHFTDTEIEIVLKNIHKCLNENGVISFNVKQGTGDTWVSEKNISKRFINFQSTNNIRRIVTRSGFRVLSLEDGFAGDLPSHTWIRVIAQKINS